ncbi:hypothetical protein D9757_002276 [Collybiopsis confluens]|uniref:Uncharacterized protein n=1 Tax=Collybiopsis confluens TaxID=2823264 RepID=A0A8H5MFI7_9AGAR|nr:hypothetical protein D9757_002276 [Collybiopsis confluens]
MTPVSSFSPLKRNIRTRTRKNQPSHLFLSQKIDLQIIPEEEDEPRPSCSSWSTTSSCNTPDLKRRRPISPRDIRIARTHDLEHSILLSAPRPAPRPPRTSASPASSPDSFQLNFIEESFKFPHPPLPTPSSSDHHYGFQSPLSSPSSDSSDLPLTPTSSDDDESQPPESLKFVPRRASIRPLTIVKNGALTSMFSHSPSVLSDADSVSSDMESEPESDSEWYSRELSQIITLRSALPPNFPKTVKLESARPESMIGSVHTGSLSPASSASSSLPSPQLDPYFARRRYPVPTRLPPSPPPRQSLVPSPAVFDDDVFSVRLETLEPHRRPPPRMSIPADFGFFSGDSDSSDDEDDDDNVLTYYVEAENFTPSTSSGSFYSQPSHIERFSISDLEEDELEFAVDTDIDRPIMLPLSLPNTPIDLETDIANGLAELHLHGRELMEVDAPVDERPLSSYSLSRPASQRQSRRVSVPIAIDWNLSEEEEIAADEARIQVAAQGQAQTDSTSVPALVPTVDVKETREEFVISEEAIEEPCDADCDSASQTTSPILRSRWSSSTLSSIRLEQQQPSRGWRTSKLRLYFGGSKKRSNSISTSPLSPTTPFTPPKPIDLKQKAKNQKRTVVVVGPSSSASASSGWSYGSTMPPSSSSKLPSSAPVTGPMSPYYDYSSRSPASKRHRQRGSDDVLVIGYGQQPYGYMGGVRRRGSTSTSCSSAAGSGASDASSILSGSSSASSGLRRKPIPVEMFLRT